jgi:hypothetical protein
MNGEGFAFFRWHALEYGDMPWTHVFDKSVHCYEEWDARTI